MLPNTASAFTKTATDFSVLSSLSRQPRHVLLVTDSLAPSGVGEHMVTLGQALQEQVQVSLLFPATPEAISWVERARAGGLVALTLPADALRAGGPEYVAMLDEIRPDVVHVHAGIGWEGHQLAAVAQALDVPAIIRTEHLPYTLRALKDPALEAVYARGVESVKRIICVCEAARCTFRMSGIEQARYTVVHNGIAPKRPQRSRDAVRAELGVGDERLVLTVARFTGQKRHATLLKALPALLGACPDVRLAWVGTGPLEQELRADAGRRGLADRVLFLGRRGDVPDLMGAADLFCLPSFFEGHPLVVLEAMAAGLPVVATRSLGTTEAVRNGETGLLVPVDNAAVLAAAMARLLNDAALASRLKIAARNAICEDFSAARMAHATLAVYREVFEAAQRQQSAVS